MIRDRKLNFRQHIDKKVSIANRILGIIYRTFTYLNPEMSRVCASGRQWRQMRRNTNFGTKIMTGEKKVFAWKMPPFLY